LSPYVSEIAYALCNIAVIVMLLMVLIIGKYDTGRALRIKSLKAGFFFPTFLMITGIITVTIVVELLLYNIGIIKWSVSIVPFAYSRSSLLWFFGSMNMIVLAPLMQELLLRGLLQSSLLLKVKPWLAITIPSVLFSLVIMQSQHFIIVLLTFVGYGTMVYFTGSIAAAMIMHSLYNVWLIAYNLLSYREIIPRILDVDIVGALVLLLSGILFVTGSIVLCKRQRVITG
jgi:membrane protease YdiL (CAAX protease family)